MGQWGNREGRSKAGGISSYRSGFKTQQHVYRYSKQKVEKPCKKKQIEFHIGMNDF